MNQNNILEYRRKLLECGKRLGVENPDDLSTDEMMAVMAEIFDQVNKIDMEHGYEFHETGIRLPKSINKETQDELFIDFVDWYQIVNTPSHLVYEYVLKKYPVQKFPRILCVGDGKKSHLGRKLAMKGYQVVSVDPEAETKYTWHRDDKNSIKTKGKFRAVNASFFDSSEDMINWSSLIVGSKIPPIVESLINTNKPSVFSISGNPEIYKMRFNGVPITSEKQFEREIKKCKGVKSIDTRVRNGDGDSFIIFEKEVVDKGEMDR